MGGGLEVVCTVRMVPCDCLSSGAADVELQQVRTEAGRVGEVDTTFSSSRR
jgi:hypothetical protein